MSGIPGGFAKLTAGPYEWGFSTAAQRNRGDRRIPYAQGKVLGGGGSINSQVFTRGAPEDYDRWSERYGCDGWSFADIRPYFVSSEDNSRLGAPWHGTGGPLGVSDFPELHPRPKPSPQPGSSLVCHPPTTSTPSRSSGSAFAMRAISAAPPIAWSAGARWAPGMSPSALRTSG